MEEFLIKFTAIWRYISVFCQAYNSLSLVKSSFETVERLNRLESAVSNLAEPCNDDDDSTRSMKGHV